MEDIVKMHTDMIICCELVWMFGIQPAEIGSRLLLEKKKRSVVGFRCTGREVLPSESVAAIDSTPSDH
jgi:hypothetical protein